MGELWRRRILGAFVTANGCDVAAGCACDVQIEGVEQVLRLGAHSLVHVVFFDLVTDDGGGQEARSRAGRACQRGLPTFRPAGIASVAKFSIVTMLSNIKQFSALVACGALECQGTQYKSRLGDKPAYPPCTATTFAINEKTGNCVVNGVQGGLWSGSEL